jgi:anti-sigma factor RsiW
MTDPTLHLTEEQRQSAAEGSLAPEQEGAVSRHLAECASCASDVARLARVAGFARQAETSVAPPEATWTAIRARIDGSKIVSLPATAKAAASRPWRRWSRGWLGGALVAAVASAVLMLGRVAERSTGAHDPETVVIETGAPATIMNVADSSAAYEEEARVLYDRFALERSLVRPEARAAIDRDLRVVDSAIVELNAAVAQDPGNPVLRQLLASSYRERVNVLRRVSNAE